MTTTTPDPVSTATATEAFADRIFQAVLGAQEVQATYLGHQLGLYAALGDSRWCRPDELASRTGTDERYVREWLEHQAVAGYLDAELVDEAHDVWTFRLPPAHAEVLLDVDSLAHVAPLAHFTAAMGRRLDDLADAYRTGSGLPWEAHGEEGRCAQAAANRPLFLHQLPTELVPQVPDLHAALVDGATVADLGCGAGWSAIGLALAHPDITVDGYDLDQPSIEMARRHAAEHGVDERVRFHPTDVADLDLDGRYDVVLAFECVHDMADPATVLAAARRMCRPGGIVLVMDERVGDAFSPEAGPVEQLMYGYSLTCCLPDGRSAQPSAATGTVMRPATLDRYARAAGFAGATDAGVDHETFRFYRLVP